VPENFLLSIAFFPHSRFIPALARKADEPSAFAYGLVSILSEHDAPYARFFQWREEGEMAEFYYF